VLEPWQEAQVAGAIRVAAPSIAGERYTRWTKKAIVEYVRLSFGVPFNTWQVDSHLRRWGFATHKQVRRAYLNQPGRDGSSVNLWEGAVR
jgi:transposase